MGQGAPLLKRQQLEHGRLHHALAVKDHGHPLAGRNRRQVRAPPLAGLGVPLLTGQQDDAARDQGVTVVVHLGLPHAPARCHDAAADRRHVFRCALYLEHP